MMRKGLIALILLLSSMAFLVSGCSDDDDDKNVNGIPSVTAIDMTKPETLNGSYTIKSFTTVAKLAENANMTLSTDMLYSDLAENDTLSRITYHKGEMNISLAKNADNSTTINIFSKLQMENDMMRVMGPALDIGELRYQYTVQEPIVIPAGYPLDVALAEAIIPDPTDNTKLTILTTTTVPLPAKVNIIVEKIADAPATPENKPYWTYTDPLGLDNVTNAVTLLGRYSVMQAELLAADNSVLKSVDLTESLGEFAVSLTGISSFNPSVKFQINDSAVADLPAAFKGKGLIQSAFPTPIGMEGENFIKDLFTKIGGVWVGTEDTDLTVVRSCVELGTSCEGGSIKFYLVKVSDNLLPVNDSRPYFN